MTTDQSQQAKLDEVIRQARYLLFAFDGPIRSMGGGDRPDEANDTAPPTPYIHDALAACHESGRFAAVICTAPAAEVLAYLNAHDLFTRITLIATSIGDAITELEASPSECALITSMPTDAQATGVLTIVYANKPDMQERMPETQARPVIGSMADLALSLRARPLLEVPVRVQGAPPPARSVVLGHTALPPVRPGG